MTNHNKLLSKITIFGIKFDSFDILFINNL